MKKASLLFAVVFSLSCEKNYIEFKGWAPPPPGFVPIPKASYDRFYSYVGVLYEFGIIFTNDSSHAGKFAIGDVTDKESYPADSARYRKDIMDNEAQNYFNLLFEDQKNNKRFMEAYQMSLTKYYKLEPGEQYRRTITFIYPLTDSLFY